MQIRALKVSNVRNLDAATLEPGPRFNVFSGDNGQGKTNLLEAIYAVCTLRSFRTSRLRDLVRIGEERAYIAARVARGGLERRYELTVGQRSRVVRLDGKAVRPIARYFGQFNVVLFAPEDLLVPRGSPSDRRRFLDRAVFSENPTYLATVQQYEKLIKSRNALLRDEDMPPNEKNQLLEVYDHKLADVAARVWRARRAYLAQIVPRYREAFAAITQIGLGADLAYRVSVEADDDADEATLAEALRRRLAQERRRDLARGATSSGPHRDELQFLLADQEAPVFASQGQLRALVLAWKTAEMELLAAAHEDPPALLLDDVSSELDAQRNEYLFEFLRARENQCFITTTHRRHVLLAGADRVDFSVRGGAVTRA